MSNVKVKDRSLSNINYVSLADDIGTEIENMCDCNRIFRNMNKSAYKNLYRSFLYNANMLTVNIRNIESIRGGNDDDLKFRIESLRKTICICENILHDLQFLYNLNDYSHIKLTKIDKKYTKDIETLSQMIIQEENHLRDVRNNMQSLYNKKYKS